MPADGRAGLDGQALAHGGRQYLFAIGFILVLKQFPARHTHHAGGRAVLLQHFLGLHRQGYFRAGGNEDDVGLAAVGFAQDIGALGHALAGRAELGLVENRQFLARENEHDRRLGRGHGDAPGFGALVGVGGAQHYDIGDDAQSQHLLHWLVGGAVFAQPNAVVGEHERSCALGQGREADSRPHVVAEREEGTAVGAQAAVVGNAVHGRAHGVLAYPKPHVAALQVQGLE